jgi:Fe-S-cluster containining protein
LLVQFHPILLNIPPDQLAALAVQNQSENEAFRRFVKLQDAQKMDSLVFELQEEVTKNVDCTTCGACCQNLMINLTEAEIEGPARHLNLSHEAFIQAHVEVSSQGQLIMNSIPCHFLCEKKCTIYEHRFADCREFPHLDKPNVQDRMFGTLQHYGICSIIYHVVERLKFATSFKHQSSNHESGFNG